MVRAKAPLLVCIVVAGGGAPELPVAASLGGAAAVRLAQEFEGEGARVALGVPSNHGRVWGGGEFSLGPKPQKPPPHWPGGGTGRPKTAVAWSEQGAGERPQS